MCALHAKTQDTVTGLDEVALLGTWEVQEHGGLWEHIGYRWPKKFEFNDGGKSYFYAKGNRETFQKVYVCEGYWIGGTSTGRYTLHLIQYKEYGMEMPGISMLNFVVKSFDGEKLIIGTYDGQGIATFIKRNSAGVADVTAEPSESEIITYTLNGVPVKNPAAPGVYVRSDGKKIVK